MNCTNCNTPAPFHELRPFVRSVDEAKGKQVLCLECLWREVQQLRFKPRPHTPEYNRRMSLREPIVEAVFERFMAEPWFVYSWTRLEKSEREKIRGEVYTEIEGVLI